MTFPRIALWVAPLAVGASVALSACGGDDAASPPADTSDAGSEASGDDSGNIFGNHDVVSIKVDPPTAALEVLNGAPASQAFVVTATYSDQTTAPLSKDVSWAMTNFPVGSVDGMGRYTTTGMAGGVVTITATYKSLRATAQVDVKLHIQQNPGNVPGATQSALKGATMPDTTGKWAYPYDGTVFPRGLLPPSMQWLGGAAADLYYVHLTSPHFEYESFTGAPAPGTFNMTTADWEKFTQSTDGGAQLKVTRWDGAKAAVLADHKWTIAPGSMRGTIYYWANNQGRVMRIKPGAAAPEDFANKPPLNDTNVYPSSSCLMTCHTVSADGSTIVSGGGSFGGSYDLRSGMPKKSLGGVWGGAGGRNDWYNVQWMTPAVTPDGKYMLVNSMGTELSRAVSGPNNFAGLYDTTSGSPVATSGLGGQFLAMPAFSPEGSKLVYVNAGDPTAWGGGWTNPNPGALRVMDFNAGANPMASNGRDLVADGGDPNKRIGWPSLTPDGKWVIYQRAQSADTRGGTGNLYFASTVTANQEVRCAKLDGDGYPFAAGARDLDLNYEPTFAPVAAGGYFWVVFTSRRTYGNALTGDKTVVKQLWVAAIDQSPTPGQDPSHPPFRLPGQDPSLNMRGYWALDPCKQDGQSCSSGTDCCGGYCDGSGDAGPPVCRSSQTQCSQVGDRCQTNSDCCANGSGVTCINHVCSEPPPK